jgi:hypothetical protein
MPSLRPRSGRCARITPAGRARRRCCRPSSRRRGPSRVAHRVARCVGGARRDLRHCGRGRQERQQHRDPKSGDRQFGRQVYNRILNGKTGEASSENKKARDCSRAVAAFRGPEIRSCRRSGGHRRPKSKDGQSLILPSESLMQLSGEGHAEVHGFVIDRLYWRGAAHECQAEASSGRVGRP